MPRPTKACTNARPMPPAAPVTITVLPSSPVPLIQLPFGSLKCRHHLAGEQPYRLQRLVTRDVAEGEAAEHVIDPAFLDLAREDRTDFLRRADDRPAQFLGTLQRFGSERGHVGRIDVVLLPKLEEA